MCKSEMNAQKWDFSGVDLCLNCRVKDHGSPEFALERTKRNKLEITNLVQMILVLMTDDRQTKPIALPLVHAHRGN